jgi:segregation and condensation protein B
MDALLEAGLIAAGGRKEVPGRPTLWGTTAAFLVQFGLRDLRDLPRREDLLVEPPPVVAVPKQDAPDPNEPELPLEGEASTPADDASPPQL